MDGIHDIEEVVSRRPFVLGVDTREIRGEFRVFLEVRPEASDRQLVIMRNLDEVDIGALQQLLVTCQDILEEVFIDH